MLDQNAQAQFAHGGALPGLLVGEPAGGEAQEVPVLGQHRQQISALTSDGRCVRLAAERRVAGDRGADGHGVRLSWVPSRDLASVYELTEAGATAATAIVAERREVLRRALEPLTDAQRHALAAITEPVLAGLASDRERADRICRLCDYLACQQDRCPVEGAVS
jgi:hypothetical protein